MGVLTRRGFAAAMAGGGMKLAWAALDAPWLERLSAACETRGAMEMERRYRADAVVLLLGVPVLRREGVGGGSVLWREFAPADGGMRLLEFTGYSLPERAAGLNRLGFLRELRHRNRGESIYFGVMTASNEESAEEARRALHPAAKEPWYSAIDGLITERDAQSAVARFTAPAAEPRPRLMERARQALSGAAPAAALPSGGANSFLQSLADAIAAGARETRYAYNGRLYRMQLASAGDPKATALYRERGLLPAAGEAVRVTGRVRREEGGKEAEFRLWTPAPPAHPLPLRIEYQAKSYLRLTFEAAGT